MLIGIERFLGLSRLLLIIFFFPLIIQGANPQGSKVVSKKGGVCFRVDDNQPLSRFLQFADIFNKYNRHFCLAVNLGYTNLTPDYINGLKQIRAQGDELMDHTSQHNTAYFRTTLPVDCYRNRPGVFEISSNNKVMLTYQDVDISCAKRSGYADINKDTVRGSFSNFRKDIDYYLYFPTIDKLVLIHPDVGWIDNNTVRVTDFWQNTVDLGIQNHIKYYNFDNRNIHLTLDAVKVLVEESVRFFDYYGIERPCTWIQPGNPGPLLHKYEMKEAAGNEFGYTSAATIDVSLKVFNEENNSNDDQFGFEWGDFNEPAWTLEGLKGVIADGVAKHHVLIGSDHFSNLLGGWGDFLEKMDILIQWCVTNNIPIRTYSEWTDILYNQIPDPNENIIPPLNIDLDENNVPDGYNTMEGILIKTDGAPALNDYCYSIKKTGEICSISNLGGLEKGSNQFEIWTKGASGNFIEVVFHIGSADQVFKFPAENSNWTKYDLKESINGNTELNIPANVSVMNISIRCSNFSSGEIKVGGMALSKLDPMPVELSSFTAAVEQNAVGLKWQTKTEVNNYGFEIERTVLNSKSIPENPEFEKIGFVQGNGNSNSPKNYSFNDHDLSGGSNFIYRLKQVDNDGSFKYSEEIQVSLIAENFTLFQNYPNPFNSSTIIKYAVPYTSSVSIHIYNTTGEEIEIQNEGTKEPGYYTINWRPANLPSGVYICRLEAVSRETSTCMLKTIKMLLLK